MSAKPESHNRNYWTTWTALTCLWFLWYKVHAGPQVVSIWMVYTGITSVILLKMCWFQLAENSLFLFSMKEHMYVLPLCHGTLNVCMYKAVWFVSGSVNSDILWDFFTGRLCILQGSVFRRVWTSKYLSIKEICSALKCHVIMASLEHIFSLKIAVTFFLICGFFLCVAAYCSDYECKWKTEYETIVYAFCNVRR